MVYLFSSHEHYSNMKKKLQSEVHDHCRFCVSIQQMFYMTMFSVTNSKNTPTQINYFEHTCDTSSKGAPYLRQSGNNLLFQSGVLEP